LKNYKIDISKVKNYLEKVVWTWEQCWKFSGHRNSGGGFAPLAIATGSVWVHVSPREKPGNKGGSGLTSFPLPFPAGGEGHRHLQNKET
jgi:hypothetical protein